MSSKHRPRPSSTTVTRTIRPGLIVIVLVTVSATGLALYGWQTRSPVQPAVIDVPPIAVVVKPDAVELPLTKLTSPAPSFGQRKQGIPLPATLLSRLNDDQTLWYVGKRTTPSLVEIPFPPGLQPGEPIDVKAVRDNPGFLGTQACQACHQEKYDSFVQTAHHLTSRPATGEAIAGSFTAGANVMRTKDANVSFTMVARDSRFYQQVRFYGWEFEIPFDLVIGSSKLGQAFLYWDFNSLYQTHVTYLAETDTWTNSPGYLDGDAAYARPIRGRCMECHSTFADVGVASNQYVPKSIILGISCERCHGPGKQHVDYHVANATDKAAHFVTVPSKLSRTQQMDVCGQCHSGGSQPKGMPFAFRPGDRLEDHYHPLDEADESNSVHASNQATRLAKSKCFQQSQMACVDCHNPHRKERNQSELFSQRCLKCHQAQGCGEFERLGDRIRDNCIDCHMPKEATQNMTLESRAGAVFPPLRDHHIRVDSKATERFYREAAK